MSAVQPPSWTHVVFRGAALVLVSMAPSAAAGQASTAVTPGIYLVSVNGSSPQLLYRGTINSLSLGPTGLIAFRDGNAVRVADVGFAHVRTIGRAAPDQEFPDAPAWSPDGKTLAVDGTQCPNPDAQCQASSIYLFDPAGRARPRRIVISGQWPSWSPDGKTLAYHGHWVVDRQGPEGPQWLFVANANGEHPHVIAHGYRPLFSPRSSTIGYVSERDGGVTTGLHTILATGKADRLLLVNGADFAWSPDGSGIASGGGPLPAPTELLVLPASGGKATRIASLYASNERPAWSANGARLVWIDFDPRTHADQLFTAPADGSHPAVELTRWAFHTVLHSPAFTPTGKTLLVIVAA